jgi:hypothetical protein
MLAPRYGFTEPAIHPSRSNFLDETSVSGRNGNMLAGYCALSTSSHLQYFLLGCGLQRRSSRPVLPTSGSLKPTSHCGPIQQSG